MYESIKKLQELRSLLQDELSRQVFDARLLCDIAPTFTHSLWLDSLRGGLRPADAAPDWKEIFSSASKEGKKLVLYGSGISGQRLARYLLEDGIDFYAFVGRSAAAYPDGIMGKPVFPPNWLFSQGDDVRVVISASFNNSCREIEENLKAHNFPQSHVLPYFAPLSPDARQYFDFPQLYRKGAAFIDGGCFDGKDSLSFDEFAGGGYSKIYAFEPDPANCARCKEFLRQHGVRNAEVFQAGLSDRDGFVSFVAKGSDNSFIIDKNDMPYNKMQVQEIQIRSIDSVAGDEPVGFIKMDIEGSEFDALRGAERVIRRDAPLIAVSVDHRFGDMPAIMQYLYELVPGYRFWLRQYACLSMDTVLYAAIPPAEQDA